MNSLDPYNLVLVVVVGVFWGAVVVLARMNGRRTPFTLLVVPIFFVLLGMSINLYHLPWGTYTVAFIHVMMLPALRKIAQNRP